ncbi:MAG: hypothetical protein FWD68_09135 [Alphaproteobacteria bacterium]|nr:hypothetical protein [Alphaproteobacteria bacterium]
MKIIRRAFLTTAFAVAPLAAFAAPELAPHPSAFQAAKGITIVVAPTADDKAALVRVQGVNLPIDNVVFLAEKTVQGERTVLSITYDGRSFGLIVNNEGGSYWSYGTKAFLPGGNVRDGIQIGYDEEASKKVDLKALADAYDGQVKNGVQDKLARFDRDRAIAKGDAGAREADEQAAKACGVPVKTTIDWGSVTDDQMQRLSIGGFCGTVAEAAQRLCVDSYTNKEQFKAWLGGHSNITCQFGDRLRLSADNGTIAFRTSETAPNQGEFAVQFLRNQ